MVKCKGTKYKVNPHVPSKYQIFGHCLGTRISKIITIESSTLLKLRTSNLCICMLVYDSARKPVWQKIQPSATISTNHKTDLKFQLMSNFVIGWKSCRCSKNVVALSFWQTVVRKYARAQFRRFWLKRARNQFTTPHYLSLLWIFSIVCNVIVHHNNYILIGYSVFVNNLVGMAYVSLMPIIPITIATSDQDDPDFSAIGNFIFSRQIWTLYRNQLINSVEFFFRRHLLFWTKFRSKYFQSSLRIPLPSDLDDKIRWYLSA